MALCQHQPNFNKKLSLCKQPCLVEGQQLLLTDTNTSNGSALGSEELPTLPAVAPLLLLDHLMKSLMCITLVLGSFHAIIC